MARAVKKQALGRGLSALLKDSVEDIHSIQDKNADKVVGTIVEIDISDIEVNPYQPRTYFNEEALRELASSIKELGVIQPITVRKRKEGGFQLVSGERRFRASKLVGLRTIPAYIRLANDQEMLEMALVENIQRQDLDPIEVALSYQRLIEEIKLTQEQLSTRVGKNRTTVTNYLRLLKLDPIIQTGMRDGFLSMGHGRALIAIEDQNDQLDIYEKVIKNKLSVRQTEQLVKSLKEGVNTSIPKEASTTLPKFAEEGLASMAAYLDQKISINVAANNKGKIVIPFNSKEDFERIKKLLQ